MFTKNNNSTYIYLLSLFVFVLIFYLFVDLQAASVAAATLIEQNMRSPARSANLQQ